ncbi:50S ribosomal protein L24 [Schleiferia thermophila]|jgi:large subunit ribosomal protein L24|uniref:Large ribosomal subunit protein uL24 n=1 Tax=Schleiferia thermophila TaxID=884107 RepID=A0A369A657_9FLAO|nr:50S ribosomal protein L24 [Schleiferia thermophila]KFD38356.1 50S ribosomal protein L24 [Schleiferia thermophila str. Yellowstone]RCX04830.1 large subunit ribosomal protein L24 [Schleiferia thermophila]GCD79643.1 50S ribosomal protein L24 [Schleiferia thermophila]
MVKFHIKKGDKVKVIAGDEKGAEGEVLRIIRDKNRAVVKGINMVKKHVKPTAQNPEGRIVEMEAPIHISNLMLIDPKTGQPTRIARKRDENGNPIRISKKSNEII